ncbi:MAG: transcriptional repressor [Betaproteobacteria bacterium]|jgi:Fur family ferric uptake transcriptional regulator|uniref:Uncharacterized protein n=1 Tax=Thiomonas delicata TaxID=364030 RepID=A0A238D127_THIDL|nr:MULTISPECIES: transcriptional repressor [Thiomonas]MDE2130116.1 transcriptional repressor [Betaproteobacteria bacterium]SBP86904.1 conserved hypothetical protein [Thiomonas delicata]
MSRAKAVVKARRIESADLLRAHGLRATPAALAVLATLDASSAPLTHEAIAARLPQTTPVARIDRVTLYRVLERMTRCGLLHRFQGQDRIWRFALGAEGGLAGMFECTRCHSVAPLPGDPALPGLLAQVQRKLRDQGLEGMAAELTVHGLCKGCRT